MNKGFLQSSPVQQQMMAGNPNWWNINSMRPPLQQPSPFFTPTNSNLYPQYIPTSSSSSSSLPLSNSWHDHNQEFPESWSQLLSGGLVGEEEKSGLTQFEQDKKLENWESQLLHHQPAALPNNASLVVDVIKQENPSSANNYFYVQHDQNHHHEDFQAAVAAAKPTWSSPVVIQLSAASPSPPKSCVTSFSSNMLDFSNTKLEYGRHHHPPPDRSSECNSTSTGGAVKKARVQPSSTQSPFKVRKEKLGDRITSLHQIVSPFGKTDTASVLLEAIGYIRFLQSQIEALSLPYLGSGSGNMRHQQSALQGERNCIFPEDPGQLLNDNCMKRKGASEQESYEEPKKDLRSRGLCLVPLSSTLQVGSDNGADYWAPALGGGGFR